MDQCHTMKQRLVDYIEKVDPQLSTAQAIYSICHNDSCTLEELGVLTMEDIVAADGEVKFNRILTEQFEMLEDTMARLKDIEARYDKGALSLPGYVEQAKCRMLVFIDFIKVHSSTM